MLTTTRRIHRPAIACALACALFASAISTATARPFKPTATPAATSSPASEPRLHELCAGVTLPECERQVLASHGIGAPAPPAAAVERTPSSDASKSRQAERLRQIEPSACRRWSTPTSPSPARCTRATSS